MKTNKKRAYIYIDPKVLNEIRRRDPSFNLSSFVRRQLFKLTGWKDHSSAEGIKVRCKRCNYHWTYTGSKSRIKCHMCGAGIRTGIWKMRADGEYQEPGPNTQ